MDAQFLQKIFQDAFQIDLYDTSNIEALDELLSDLDVPMEEQDHPYCVFLEMNVQIILANQEDSCRADVRFSLLLQEVEDAITAREEALREINTMGHQEVASMVAREI